MPAPTLDIVPVITDRNGSHVAAVVIYGLSTKGDSKSESGKLFVDMISGGGYTVEVFADYARTIKIMTGNTMNLDVYFPLTAFGGSGVTGKMMLSGSGEPKSAILIPTFNLDADVFHNVNYAPKFPGYDAMYGLAHYHAAAMRRMMISDLPASLPNLYRGKKISAFVPLSGGELPDLSDIAAPDSLRDAHALLVKHLAAREASHVEEFREIATDALDEYTMALKQFSAANAPAETEAKETASTISFGYFTR